MKLRSVGIMTGLVGLVLSGCEEPGEIIPVSPPGAAVIRTSPDAGPAEAQGEAVDASRSSAPKLTSSVASKPALPTAIGETKTTEGGVKYETLKEGTGAELKRGQRATLHSVGTLAKSNKVFDSTRTTNQPRSYLLGGDPLIKGWEQTLPGMKVGEIRRFTVPPELGYGETGKTPAIPANATLIFEVELLSVDEEQ
jgi:FKBP-type peptidyl-prolyl cis-trans isomerase FkpA